jgi:hypothetical protein
MKLKALMPVAVLALSATACGYSIQTATDYDRTVNFGGYHTFFIMKGNSSGNALLDQRATEDVRRALTSKGWAEVPEGKGRAAVVVHAASKTQHVYETFYDGWGGWRWRWEGMGRSKCFTSSRRKYSPADFDHGVCDPTARTQCAWSNTCARVGVLTKLLTNPSNGPAASS